MVARGNFTASLDLESDVEDAADDLAREMLGEYCTGAETAYRVGKLATMVRRISDKCKVKGNLLTKISAAYMSPKNACRTIRRLVKCTPGVALKIPVNVFEVHVKLRKPVRVLKTFWPMLTVSDWVRYLVSHKPQLLLAGSSVDGAWRDTFSGFWEKYRQIDGSHPIYSESFDYSSCIPVLLHGDEGRGHLRRPFLVLSFQCLIGHHGPETVNDTSHALCTRFLFTCISSHLYYQNWTMDDITAELSKQLLDAFYLGICDVGGSRLRLVCIGVKGDWPFLRKACSLKTGFTAARICHRCSSKEWENPREDASWRTDSCDLPFKGWAPLHQVPGGGYNPEHIRLDFLHVFHIGYGMDAASSSIILLAKLGHFGDFRKLDDCLAEAFARFDLWCKGASHTTSIDEFSTQSFGMGKNGNTFPTSLGGKAYDTGLTMMWLEADLAESEVDPSNELFQLCSYMIRCGNKFFRMLRREGVLLEGDACTVARTAGHEMNVAYAALASATFEAGMQLYKYRPKYHLGVHVPLDIQWPLAINPWCMATWCDEDFVGKISRTARSTHPLTQAIRTIEKCLGQYAQQFNNLNS